jgi:hypothetical protein
LELAIGSIGHTSLALQEAYVVYETKVSLEEAFINDYFAFLELWHFIVATEMGKFHVVT